MDVPISGGFYELQFRWAGQEVYRFDKVLENISDTVNFLVKWKCYPDKFNSCEREEDLT